jgi:hypothetical protein
MEPTQAPARSNIPDLMRRVVRKAITVTIVTIAFGYFYGWASPWAFPDKRVTGFGYGVLHGGLMPMALPSLVLGKDVHIYSSINSGRGYKIGYICGINACGLLFFGSMFLGPKKNQKNQVR